MHACPHEGCQAVFKQRSHLNRHAANHLEEGKFKCKECDTTFKRLDCLHSHIMSHTDERSFKCTYEGCDSSFRTSGHLKVHERIHAGIKPYKCDECDESFSSSSYLKTHKLIHTGEKPFKCEFCEFTTRQMSNLRSHQRIHTGEKPFTCPFEGCESKFSHKHHLDAHYYYNHTEEGASERKREEMVVKRFLDEKLPESYIREMRVDYTCLNQPGLRNKFSRIDFVLPHLVPNTVILLEVDEGQHKHYDQSCEQARMHDVVASLRLGGTLENIVFVRYNPHGFTVDGKKGKVKRKERLAKLVETMKSISPEGPPFEVKYLFYDSVIGDFTIGSM
jgi:Zinc finger, C2H2 type